jgi:F0F1-type ATP synthase membrane subunit b/b'
MAQNIDERQQELSAAMLRAQQDIAMYGKLHTTTAEQLKDAQMKAKYGSESFTKGANTAAQALGALAGAGIESTKAMYQGKKGMGAFNSSLDELSKAAALAGTALTLLMPGGFIMKAIVGAFTLATTAAIAYVKAANDMADKLYKNYEGLQK